MKSTVLISLAASASAVAWKDASGNPLDCPKADTYGHTWTLERHTSSRHGDVCRGQGGHWQPPSGCGKGGECKTHACMEGTTEICRVAGAPKPTVCPPDGKHGHVWSVEDHSGSRGKIGDLCRGQNGHWFPPVNCKRHRGPPYAVFAKDTPQGKLNTACRVPKDIYKAGVALDIYACEGQEMKITCPAGSAIKIVDASYGREVDGSTARHNKVCPGIVQSAHVGKCTSAAAEGIVKMQCHGKQACALKAANHVFGDPCGGTKKYLNVHYECAMVAELDMCHSSNCKNWDCKKWCECYDEADETAGIYNTNGCLDDGADQCDCAKVQPSLPKGSGLNDKCAAINVNDFSDFWKMQQVGWSVKGNLNHHHVGVGADKRGAVCNNGQKNWWGWSGGKSVGHLNLVSPVTSTVTIDVGNCWNTGNVRVYANGVKVLDATKETSSKKATFSVKKGETISIRDEGRNSVMRLNSLQFESCVETL